MTQWFCSVCLLAQSGTFQHLRGGLPPGPPGLPFLGNMIDLSKPHLPLHLTGLARRYGCIYSLSCGNSSKPRGTWDALVVVVVDVDLP